MPVKPSILITGKTGQLGWELQQLQHLCKDEFEFIFTGREEIDLAEPNTITTFLRKCNPRYVINCAAYTAVDKAETEQALAYTCNAESVGVMARECTALNCRLISFSTDYVFDGKAKEPYTTAHATNPVNYYGYTKSTGEQLALQNCANTVIIRTSWVYSAHGNNFVKTILRLLKERGEVKVVNDQFGSPTYAGDLANATLEIVRQLEKGNRAYGIYHYTNKGIISWYDFAAEIGSLSGPGSRVLPIPSILFPTVAKRPAYSVLDNQAITNEFGIQITPWEKSLADCLEAIKKM